jgi:aromatic ring-opening dioxygenase LigB subunit
MIAFAAIAPHGDVDGTPELLAAMEELGRRCEAEVAVVVTPHNVHVEGHFAVVTSARVREHETDRALAAELIAGARAEGLPVAGVSYGGNDPAEAEMPLDEGPYGFHPAAEAYDRRFRELLDRRPLDFAPLAELVDDAKADSLWQLLVLQGAAAGEAELLAYAAPTYYGMAVAVVAAAA